MMEELVRNDKELATRLSDIDVLENIIETPISPNVGGALHQNSSTVIQVGKTKFDRQFSYIPPLPHISRKQLHLLHKNQLKDFNSNANVQPSTNGLKTALSCSDTQGTRPMSVSKPRVVPNETQETVDGRKVFCGILNLLLDNWMEDKGLTQDVTSLAKQPAKIQEARQEVMSPGKQPITLEMTKQEVTSTEAPAMNDCLQDGELVSFVDAILTAADHGRLKQANLMKNSNPKK